jgi:ClpP class serine protease
MYNIGDLKMGVYSEYLGRQLSFDQLSRERKKQLAEISKLRGREIIVYASDMHKPNIPNLIDLSDVVPFNDQLSMLNGENIDIILQTPGGYAEVVEKLVKSVRSRFEHVGIIVPGGAYSAGTIFAMAADEILMSPTSSLGPIDAQIVSNGKRFSADAFLKGIEKIKDEAKKEGKLNIAYIPMLQNISPGEIQHCENAQAFSCRLVTDWLKQYKFKFWDTHSSNGSPVTEEDKQKRAEEIATQLCSQEKWLTHSRSIQLKDLQDLRLIITDYSTDAGLYDAINRYYTLLQMSFETNIYKIYETANSQIYRSQNPPMPPMPQAMQPAPMLIEFECQKCKATQKIQINFGQPVPLASGAVDFPKDNIYKCRNCNAESNLLGLRQQIEAQTGKKI